MTYTTKQLADLSGVSPRTLRYYDQINLLKPARSLENDYRIYGKAEVDRLQEILFYRELDISLEEIKILLSMPNYDKKKAMKNHLTQLQEKKKRMDLLIKNVSNTIQTMEGKIIMNDKEKFEGFAQNLIDENEGKYGKEMREKYGDKVVDQANTSLKGKSKEQFEDMEKIRVEYERLLKEAVATGDTKGELAQKVVALHKEWLTFYYPDYTREYHVAMGEMYVGDERFRQYYDDIAPGAAEFLREAINNFYQ